MTTSRVARVTWFAAVLAALSLLGAGLSAGAVAAPASHARQATPVLGVPMLERGVGPDHDGWRITDGRVRVPVPDTFTDPTGAEVERPDGFQLLGEAPAGYVLSSLDPAGAPDPTAYTFGLHLLARDGTATTFWQSSVSVPQGAAYPTAFLSGTGSQVYVGFQTEGSPQSRIVGLDGTVEDLPSWVDPRVLDFPGSHRLLFVDHQTTPTFDGQRIGVRHLREGTTTNVRRGEWPRTRVSVGDLGADVYALEQKRTHRTTFYRVSKPRKALWSARFVASTLNPTGTLVAGWRPKGGELQIRRVRDGKLLNTRPSGRGDDWSPQWEDDDHLLLYNLDSQVWRCTTSGKCRYLFMAEAGISFPTSS